MLQDPRRQLIWHPILSRYTPSFVQQCHWAVENGRDFVAAFLADGMFSDMKEPEKSQKIDFIVDKLTDLSKNKGHDKHLHAAECKDIGLIIRDLEDPKEKTLQDLVLTVHHCYMYTLANTPVFKIIENHVGRRYLKMQHEIHMLMPAQPGPVR